MLTEQRQELLLQPFQTLMGQFELEFDIATQTLNEWNKARSISTSLLETPDNDALGDKILQLEKGKNKLDEFIRALMLNIQFSDIDFDVITENLQSSYLDFSLMFHEARALLNFKYTVIEKNDINRRITAVNSSHMLSNADMNELQSQWSIIIQMKNDARLAMSKKIFESRLKDWENLIAQKANKVHLNE